MSVFKQLLSVVLIICLILGSAACATEEPVAQEEPEVVEEPVEEPAVEPPSVGLILTGSINDMDWNADGYEGIMRIQEKYGAEVSYAENVQQSDFEEVLRNYAEVGYDIIIGHSGQFMDAIVIVADSYPDTQFICVNGVEIKDNLTNIASAEKQAGFLMGAAAALMSETNKVGVIGSVDILPVRQSVDAFAEGAKYVNPDIEVLSTMTGDWSDAIKAKEIAIAMFEDGADVIGNRTGSAGSSIIQAGEENGIFAIGASVQQHEIAPETSPVVVIRDLAAMFTYIYDQVIEETLEQKNYELGIREGVVFVSAPAENVAVEILAELDVIADSIANGEIELK